MFVRSYAQMMRLVFKDAPSYVQQTKQKMLDNAGRIKRSSFYTGEMRMPGDLPVERDGQGRDASGNQAVNIGRGNF